KTSVGPPPKPSLGRGGPEHKRLQSIFKNIGEDLGYIATIEKQIPDSLCSVDVALTKPERSIACEISINSTPDYELTNIKKCLAAQFSIVIAISGENRFLSHLKQLTTPVLSPEDLSRVHFLPPEEAVFFIQEISADDLVREDTVKGYKVKIS